MSPHTCSPFLPHLGSANGQLNSGYVYNWTSWMDDYGFGKCPDLKRCNVFPDGKPFPQSNDWRRRSYVYVWHAMGRDDSLYRRCIRLHHAISYLNVHYRTGA